MDKPPTSLVIEMTEQDVQDNLVNIVNSMDRIRQESITNFGASDGQKIDYLRLTEELASCLKPFIEENQLEEHAQAVTELVNSDLLLRNYDPLQPDFWQSREPGLKTALDDAAVVLLRDDFVSEAQPYHVFQALKYLTITDDNDREDVYETILPVNSLLNENSLNSPEISGYLMKKLLAGVARDGIGIKASFDMQGFIRNLEQTGALYADVSKELYREMKKHFPQSILVDENGQKYTRVIFGNKEAERGANVFKQLQEYAQLDLGEIEESLVWKVRRFYEFGKDFLEAMKERIGFREAEGEPAKAVGRITRANVVLDESPEDNGKKRTQDKWFKYWNKIKDGRVMASMGDFYLAFKDLRQLYEQGTDEEKAKAQELLVSLRDDFQWPRKNNWLIGSTRLSYLSDSLDAKITQHYKCSQPELVKETELEIPVYRNTPITQVIENAQGLTYLQNLFDTEDDGEEIIQTLEFISDKKRDKIKVWTAATSGSYPRSSHPERAAGLDFGGDDFRVSGGSDRGSLGRSRGVLVK